MNRVKQNRIRKMRIFIFILFISSSLVAQSSLETMLYKSYDDYKESTITHRRFKHKQIISLVNKREANKLFKIKTLGYSIEGKSIKLVSVGSGKTSVLLWSQMHGNEPTATMALMDIFNFLESDTDFEDMKNTLLENLTIHFVPLLNPDGADKYQRRNAAGIDLNRDAARLQFPEGQILKHVRDSVDAEWGFNLHDQSRYYSAGQNPHTASVSFLAPAFNYEKDVNKSREEAMQLIGVMTRALEMFIPGKIAKYSDEFEPRAFGDNIQKWGTRTILIESGGLKGDREKQELRKLHFVAILKALQSIATKSYNKASPQIYHDIPFNKTRYHDLMIRNLKVIDQAGERIMDIAMRQNEIDYDHNNKFYLNAYISDLGDLHTYFGYHEIDATDLEYVPGNKFPAYIDDLKALLSLDVFSLLKQGYTTLGSTAIANPWDVAPLPIQLVDTEYSPSNLPVMGTNPSFLLLGKDGIKWAIINGTAYNLAKGPNEVKSALNILRE